jgi:hypothetical protein
MVSPLINLIPSPVSSAYHNFMRLVTCRIKRSARPYLSRSSRRWGDVAGGLRINVPVAAGGGAVAEVRWGGAAERPESAAAGDGESSSRSGGCVAASWLQMETAKEDFGEVQR